MLRRSLLAGSLGLAPAIAMAREGYAITPRVSRQAILKAEPPL